jgi:lysophospholipase L1-like esterase
VLIGTLAFLVYQNDKEEKVREQYYKALDQKRREEEHAVKEKIATIHEKLQADMSAYLPGIVCWGDSLTAGAGGNGTTYPNVLKSLIKENLVDQFDPEAIVKSQGLGYILGVRQYILDTVDVVNMGVGGENTNTILGRDGAIPFVVKDDFTIPSEVESVEINFISENGKDVAPLRQGSRGMDSVSIAGIEGVISIEQESYTSEKYTYYFTRRTAGASVDVTAGTEIITSASTQCLDYIPIIFIGQNGGYDDINDLIAQQRAIISHQKMSELNQGKFIIVGLHTGTEDSRRELEAAMQAEYGDQYINLRDYMATSGLKDAGIEPTEEDKEMMADGMTPASLMNSDKLHFNEAGYKLIGNLIYERMDELGYFDQIKEDLVEVEVAQ